MLLLHEQLVEYIGKTAVCLYEKFMKDWENIQLKETTQNP